MTAKAALLALLCCLPPAARAQDLEFFDFERASLEDILDIRTRAASRLEFQAREAPGIVTVLTREELRDSGARDLIDALRLVPGLSFGVDVEGMLGLGVRGNWAHEGKVLVLVDGQRYNEPFFGTPQLERIPVEQVERLEVIRGPGSVVYGGSAGLAVIKVATRGWRSINGAQASAAYGLTARGAAERRLTLALGVPMDDGGMTAQFSAAGADRGDRRYTDFSGGSYSMKGASDLESRVLNVGFHSGGLSGRLIADQFRTSQRDHYDATILPRPMARNFDAYFAEVKRDFSPSETLTLTPALNYSWQKPYTGYDAVEYPRDKSSRYVKGTLTGVYASGARSRLSGGAELSLDEAFLDPRTAPAWYFKTGGKYVHYYNTALFAEAVTETGLGVLSAGARYDRHQKFAPAFSPRLAWTTALDNWHLKAICSGAFRAPGIDNLDANSRLRPEKTFTKELEAGYKPGDDLYLSANLFYTRIKDPIVFYVDGSGQHYGNYGETGTRGFELAAKLKMAWGYGDLSWSHYAAYGNRVDFYNSGGSGALLAFARNKFALNSSFKATESFSVNPSAVYYSGRRGYAAAGVHKRFSDSLLANLNLRRTGLLRGRLEAGLGVYNLFNTAFSDLQPYDGGHAPLPALSREYRLSLTCRF